MKLLIAEQDRDFAGSFRTLLEWYGHDVTTVYDGTQVITKLAGHSYDAAVIDGMIPRVSASELVEALNKKNIPVIVMSSGSITANTLSSGRLANAYIQLPFLPKELLALLDSVEKNSSSGEKLVFEDAEINVSAYGLCGTVPVTEGEIEVFRSLINKNSIDLKSKGPCITALNHKLEQLHKKTRIRYLINEGYRLVTI